MMFDAVCKMAERAPRSVESLTLQSILRIAAIVRMPGIYKSEDHASTNALFRMLWDVMAIEDDEGCAIIKRIGKASGLPDADLTKGFTKGGITNFDDTKRNSTSDIGIEVGDTFLFVACDSSDATEDVAAGGSMATIVVHSLKDDGGPILIGGMPTAFALMRNGDIFWSTLTQADDDAAKDVIYGMVATFSVVLTQCIAACRPGTWVLREMVSAKMAGADSPKIPRSHQRPRWIVVSDEERARYFRSNDGDADGERRQIAAHPRRAHYRLVGFHEDGSRRYTWVRACWVGPQEATMRGARYRVELDL